MLVYFDPWIAGVVMPTLIIVGLMVIPYIDANPLGNGYYTYKQRKFAIWTFIFGFIVLWVAMIVIGTFIRGPGWMWFWPGTDLGSQPADLRGEPRSARSSSALTSNMRQKQFSARSWWAASIVVGGGAVYSLFRRKMPQGFPTHEPAAVFADGVSVADHDCVAVEDGSAAAVPHQVRVDNAVVQRVRKIAAF